MNSRKRYHVEVDRLSRIEEDLERLSLCGDQPNNPNSQLKSHQQQHLQQHVQDKLLESIPLEQHFMGERNQEHFNRDDKLLQHIQEQHKLLQQQQILQQRLMQQQMLKHVQAQQIGHLDSMQSKHLQQDIQHQFSTDKQYCRIEHLGGASNSRGNQYQHLTEFRSGRLANFEEVQPVNHLTMNEQKVQMDFPDNSEGAKFLKEKYDSLGKVKVSKPQNTSINVAGQSHQEHDGLMSQFQAHVANDAKSQPHGFIQFNGPQHFQELQYFQSSQHPPQESSNVRTEISRDGPWNHHQQQFIFPVKEEHLQQQQQQHDNVPKEQTISNQQQNLKPQQSQERCLLNEHDLMQVDIFYRSQRSKIFVSRCCASLMIGPKWSFQSTGSLGGSPASGVRQLCRNFRDWACVKSGVPVLVLDTTKNELCLILAEHGSGFALWRNRMGPLTGYSVIAADFHALRTDPSMQRSLANNPPTTLVTSIVGLNFVDIEAAEEFYKNVVNLSTIASSLGTSMSANRNRHVSGDHLNDSQFREHGLSNSTQDLQASGMNKQNGERTKNSKKTKKSFSKTDISQPCCFAHVTKLGDRFRDGSSRLFLTNSDTNVLLRSNATMDKKSALHRLHSGPKQKH